MALDIENEEPPFEWYRRAKRRGGWDPEEIDLEQDKEDWREEFTHEERKTFLKVCSLFYEGEESVTRELVPYPLAVESLEDPGFDTMQEEMFLTTHLYEESKHAEFFARYFGEVFDTQDTRTGGFEAVDDFWVPEAEYWIVDGLDEVSEDLRAAIGEDQETLRYALAEAAMHYMGIVEAELAEAGYTGIELFLEEKDALPGFLEGIEKVRADEGRHIANGRWLMSQLAEQDPAIVTEVYEPKLERFMQEGLGPITQSVLADAAIDINFQDIFERAQANYKATIDAIGPEKFDNIEIADSDGTVDGVAD